MGNIELMGEQSVPEQMPRAGSLKHNLLANFAGKGWTGVMNFVFMPLYIEFNGSRSLWAGGAVRHPDCADQPAGYGARHDG